MSLQHIFAISGSTKNPSSHLKLISALKILTADTFSFTVFNGLAELPHFNPDLSGDDFKSVSDFKAAIAQADGILICTPEYAHGVPGSLKNAIDWTVSSGEFSRKPTVLITASTDGRFGHEAMLETLRVIEAGKADELHLLIPFIRTKVNSAGEITHEETKKELKHLMDKFHKEIVLASMSLSDEPPENP